MNADTITISRAALTDDASRALVQALNAELSAAYSEPAANHFGLDPEDVAEGRGAFLVVRLDGTPVGCGAVRLLDAETGELKRMYVAPAARGTGLGRRLVLALYRATGFHPIPLYGEYLRSPDTSICLGKELPGQEA
jgi:putative acetyltransferase